MLRTASFSSGPGTVEDDNAALRGDTEQQQGSQFSRVHHSSHPTSLLEQLDSLRNEDKLTDVCLQTDDGQRFMCHRLVLAASCPYFAAMFTSGMGEAHSVHVPLHEIAGPVLSQFIDYCYTGSFILRKDSVKTIAEAANFLQFTAIEEECVKFMQSSLNPQNSLETEHIANRLFNRQLSLQAHDFSVGNFTDVTFSQEFLELSQVETEDFISKGVGVDSEEEVYEAVMRWVYYDKEERKGALVALMEKLLFELMGEAYILEIAAKESLLQENGDCMKIVKRARSFHATHSNPASKSSLEDLCSKVHLMRNYSEVIILIGNFQHLVEGAGQKSSSVLMYDPKHHKWDILPGSPFADGRSEFATAATAVTNDILVFTNRCRAWLYLTQQNKWSLLTNRMEGRNGGCLTTLQNEAFILGGLKPIETTRMTSVQHFNLASKQWMESPPLTSGLIHTSAIACLGKMYVVGSTSGSRYVSEMFCYSSHQGIWVACPPLPSALMRPKIVAINGTLYVLGHLNDFAMAMLCYDVKEQQWTTLEAPMVSRHNAAVAVCNNKLYLLGGWVCSSDYSEAEEYTIECYDPDSEIWSIHGDADWVLNDHQVVTVLNPLFPPARYLGPKQH